MPACDWCGQTKGLTRAQIEPGSYRRQRILNKATNVMEDVDVLVKAPVFVHVCREHHHLLTRNDPNIAKTRRTKAKAKQLTIYDALGEADPDDPTITSALHQGT
jgi:hypothetical protein